MSHNWGPHYIVPSNILENYSGIVLLREERDEELLLKELKELGINQPILRISNPWYYRKKNNETWIKIGESDNLQENFPVKWNTSNLENGEYEVMGLMHVYLGNGRAIARENIARVTVVN